MEVCHCYGYFIADNIILYPVCHKYVQPFARLINTTRSKLHEN